MPSQYLAITIGPVTETMQLARRTREFWGGSILFSLLARELCHSLLQAGIQRDDFLVPYKNIIDSEIKNVGLFHDRIVCKSPAMVYERFDEIVVAPALKRLVSEINEANGLVTYEDLKDYFRIYSVFSEAPDELPLFELNGDLNTMELFGKQSSGRNTTGKIKSFLENVNTEYSEKGEIEDPIFLKKYFDLTDVNGQCRIPSIGEISTTELSKSDSEKYRKVLNSTLWRNKPKEDDLIPALKESFGDEFKNYHKYFCILQADGDKLGTTLINSPAGTISAISDELIFWGREVLGILQEYGALPVYIGGDDLFCFAPVANNGRNIIDISVLLSKKFMENPKLGKYSSLSLGIKIQYYKTPMYAGYSSTFDLLRIAKADGNSSAINYESHSGQPHQFCFSFNERNIALLQHISNNMVISDNKKSFLSSVIYKLKANEELIKLISRSQERLWYFFENNFEEANRKKERTKPYQYLKGISDYLHYLFAKYGDTREKGEYVATTHIYSALKTIRFIKGLDDEKD